MPGMGSGIIPNALAGSVAKMVQKHAFKTPSSLASPVRMRLRNMLGKMTFKKAHETLGKSSGSTGIKSPIQMPKQTLQLGHFNN